MRRGAEQELIRLLAFVEATSVTGPAKNLLEFARTTSSVAVEIATFQRSPGENAFTAAVGAAGLPLHRIHERSAFDFQAIEGLRAAVGAVRPDILQTHAVKSHFLLRSSGLWKKLPWVASHHGYTHTNLRMRLYNELDRWSLGRAPHVLTVSEAFRQQLSGIGVKRDRITVLHNAIDAKWGDKAADLHVRTQFRDSLGIGEDEKAVLIVGRLSREKSHTGLVAALGQLKNSSPELRLKLIIVGDGPERGAIEAATEQAGLVGRVIFAGQTTNVLPYYAAADLAVLASVTEGSPNALLEAMACRVNVVATAVGGIPEIISHRDTGLLVPPGNTEAMAHAIRESLTGGETSQAMVQKARALIETTYSPERRARFLSDFYSGIVKGRKP